MSYASDSPTVARAEQGGVVAPLRAGIASFGRRDELTLRGVDTSSVSFQLASITVSSEPRAGVSFTGAWNVVEGSTLKLERGGTKRSRFDLGYSDGGGARFQYDSINSLSSAWFAPSELLSFESSHPDYVSISAAGTLTLRANHHQKVGLSAQIACASDVWNRRIWANLLPAEEDVDMGTSSDNDRAPYYFASGPRMVIHVWARPKAGQYLRAVQIKVELPEGLSAEGGEWTDNGATGYLNSASFNVQSTRVMGLTASHPSTVPAPNKVRLGHFTIPVSGTGLLSGAVTVEIVSLQSDTRAKDGAAGNLRTTTGNLQAVAALSRVFVGVPTRRRLRNSQLAWEPSLRPPARRLQRAEVAGAGCDPCTARIFGDVSGDCAFNVNDVTEAQTFATAYSTFATGTSGANPLAGWSNGRGYSCDWVKQQLNPTLDLLGGAFGGDDPADPRYRQPNINSQDVIHLSRATQYINRFLEPSAQCGVDSTAAPGSNVLLRAAAWGGVGQDTARVPSETQTPAVGTDVYFEVRVVVSPLASEDGAALPAIQVTRGSVLSAYSNPHGLYSMGTSVPTVSFTEYHRASGPQEGMLIRAEYDASTSSYVALLEQPAGGEAELAVFAAVAVEVRMNGAIDTAQIQAFLGLSTFPYGATGAGFSFEPVLGSPYSAVRRSAVEMCAVGTKPPLPSQLLAPMPSPSAPPTAPPPPSRMVDRRGVSALSVL